MSNTMMFKTITSNTIPEATLKVVRFDTEFQNNLFNKIVPVLFDLDSSKGRALSQLHKKIDNKVVALIKDDTLQNREKYPTNAYICKGIPFKLSEESWKLLNIYIKMEVLSSVSASEYLAKLLPGDAAILHTILKKLADKSNTNYAALTNFYTLASADTTRYLMRMIFRSFTERIFEYQLQWTLSKQLYLGIYKYLSKRKIEDAIYHDLLDPSSWAFLKALILEHSVSGVERKKLDFTFHYYSFPNFTRSLVKTNKDFIIALLLTAIVNYLQRLLASPANLVDMKNNISAILIANRDQFKGLFADSTGPEDMLLYLNGIYSVLLSQWNFYVRRLGIEITDHLFSEGFITTSIIPLTNKKTVSVIKFSVNKT